MMFEGIIFYIGCALIPTPPSPCPDFGLQFLFVVVLGILAPEAIIKPIYRFFREVGRGARDIFGKVPGIRVIVEKTDDLLQRWFRFMRKERESDHWLVEKFYEMFLTEDIVERLIFGYFVSIFLGLIFMYAVIFL